MYFEPIQFQVKFYLGTIDFYMIEPQMNKFWHYLGC